MRMNVFTLKENMLLGLSSPALQCEGGELESSWIYWWGLGGIRDGASPAVAAQHIQRWQEDTALLRTLGVTAHRMGIDWTRVEPHEEEFDEAALARYRAELSALRSAGIRVQLELHHFNEPAWFSERGGFEKVENFSCYLHYIEHVAATLGDLADEYLTFAEPNACALGGYLGRGFPPGKNNASACFRVLTRMAECHMHAYALLHSLHRAMGYGDCRVSVSLRLNDFVPAQDTFLARSLSDFARRAFNAAFEAFYLGRIRLPMKYSAILAPGSYCDFLAIDWQGFTPVSDLQSITPANDAPDSSAPETLLAALGALHARCPLPLSVALHGVEDAIRVPYLFEHLHALSGSALPIGRCFCGPLTDGFELLDGQSVRRGIVSVDFATQQRTPTDAYDLLRAILARGGADETLYAEYFED